MALSSQTKRRRAMSHADDDIEALDAEGDGRNKGMFLNLDI